MVRHQPCQHSSQHSRNQKRQVSGSRKRGMHRWHRDMPRRQAVVQAGMRTEWWHVKQGMLWYAGSGRRKRQGLGEDRQMQAGKKAGMLAGMAGMKGRQNREQEEGRQRHVSVVVGRQKTHGRWWRRRKAEKTCRSNMYM